MNADACTLCAVCRRERVGPVAAKLGCGTRCLSCWRDAFVAMRQLREIARAT